MNRPVPAYTTTQISAINALVGEVIDVDDCGLPPHIVAMVFGNAAANCTEDPERDPDFLPVAESIMRVRSREAA